jgi:hypothetical protein
LHLRCWALLIHEFICYQRVGSCSDKEIKDGTIGITKVLFSIWECSFDSGRDKALPGSFDFAAVWQQHAIMDGEFENLFVVG